MLLCPTGRRKRWFWLICSIQHLNTSQFKCQKSVAIPLSLMDEETVRFQGWVFPSLPPLVSCHFSVFLRSSCPVFYWTAALPAAPQPPPVTSPQPPWVLIWPIVVNPDVSFVGQLHLVPPAPFPSLSHWHSVHTQCHIFQSNWNSEKLGRSLKSPLLPAQMPCATLDNTSE